MRIRNKGFLWFEQTTKTSQEKAKLFQICFFYFQICFFFPETSSIFFPVPAWILSPLVEDRSKSAMWVIPKIQGRTCPQNSESFPSSKSPQFSGVNSLALRDAGRVCISRPSQIPSMIYQLMCLCQVINSSPHHVAKLPFWRFQGTWKGVGSWSLGNAWNWGIMKNINCEHNSHEDTCQS